MQAPGDTAQLSSIQHDLGSIRESIYRFWQQHGVDGTFGGFHGTLDRAGASVEPSYKGIVQTARHAWAFSTYYLNGYKSVADAEPYRSSSSSSSSQQMAKTAFDFMLQHLHDPKTGMFHWLVTREGQLLQDNKVIYGQWFAIYSLSQYYTAFRDPRAKELALNCFRAMDAAWHSSQFGAFDETPANGIPPAPSRAAIAEAGAAGKQQQRQQTRTLNVAMHGLEALTALHKMTQDPVVLQRIHETLHILCTRLQRTEGLIYEDYLPTADSSSSKWQPAPGTVVSYGHNLESTWLVADTLDYLLSISAIDQQLAQQYRDTVMSIGAAAVRDGFDSEHGGIYETGLPVKGPVSTVKVWWVQAESLLALWKLHEHGQSTDSSTAAATGSGSESAGPDAGAGGSRDQTGQQGQSEYYLRVLQQTARFVRQYVADGAGGGELFWEVQADGTFKPTDHLERSTKGNMWKASYHSSRSVLFLEQWMSKAGIS